MMVCPSPAQTSVLVGRVCACIQVRISMVCSATRIRFVTSGGRSGSQGGKMVGGREGERERSSGLEEKNGVEKGRGS